MNQKTYFAFNGLHLRYNALQIIKGIGMCLLKYHCMLLCHYFVPAHNIKDYCVGSVKCMCTYQNLCSLTLLYSLFMLWKYRGDYLNNP